MQGSILQKVVACPVMSLKADLALETIPFPWNFAFWEHKRDFDLCIFSRYNEHKISKSQIFQ